MMRFVDAALPLIERGWKVFPLAPGTKVPAISRKAGGQGVLDASRDRAQIETWGRRWPRANIGLACGRDSGFTVIDIDPEGGGMQTIMAFRDRNQLLPATACARTPSGGWHLYYLFEPLLKNSQSLLGKGIDIRTTGGYVVAPPSILRDGRFYRWHQEPIAGHAVPRMPRWAFEKLKPRADAIFASAGTVRNEAAALDGLEKFVANAGGGERNSSLYWAARRAAAAGHSDEGSANRLAGAALRSGLTRKEALKTIGSAFKAGRRF